LSPFSEEGFRGIFLEGMGMRKFSVVVVIGLLSVMAPALVWGFLPTGFPALGGVFGGAGCEPALGVPLGATIYVGWADSEPRGVHYGSAWIDPDIDPIAPPTTFQRKGQGYRNSGIWLGIAKTLQPFENFGFIASGWYKIPVNPATTDLSVQPLTGLEIVTTRSTRTQWWYVDGLAALGPQSGTTLLAGFRYDSCTSSLGDTVQGDFTSNAYIPLVGLQFYSCRGVNYLLMRMVGFPWVPGDLRYREAGPDIARDLSGSYGRGSYFLEFFGEYTRRFGPGNIGIFGRWNLLHASATLTESFLGLTGVRSAFAFNRHGFTVGGALNVDFNLPF
jgi:hypothetical protein